MPSLSPGAPTAPIAPTAPPAASPDFAQVLPGTPTPSLQSLTSFLFRHKHYTAYISGPRLLFLAGPARLVHVVSFDEDLVAVTAEPQSGKVIVAGQRDVYVLVAVAAGWTRVWWEKSLLLRREEEDEEEVRWLSWGNTGEVLVGGGRSLRLFSTLPSSRTASPVVSAADGGEMVEERQALWRQRVASPVAYAAFSPPASLIASCGVYDRFVKIWRRLSYEEGLFDYTYLPHPGVVTHVEWRPPNDHSRERRGSGISARHEEDAEVLYTMCVDGVMRVWRTGGVHDVEIMVLHASLDLVTAIPQSPSLVMNGGDDCRVKPPRFAFVIPADRFTAGVAAATGRDLGGKISHSLEHLKEIASQSPDVVITLDGQGRMSAWGIQSIGHKRRSEAPASTQAFHIAHAEGLRLRIPGHTNARFVQWLEDDMLRILVHSFDGSITWWEGDVETFFSPAGAGADRLELVSEWVGHGSKIDALLRTTDETLLRSISDGKSQDWELAADGRLTRSSTGTGKAEVVDEEQPDTPFESVNDDYDLSANNDEVAAFAMDDFRELVVYDRVEGYVEHRETFKEQIRHVRCSNFGSSHNFVAVSFDTSAMILAQGMYGRRGGPPTWRCVKKLTVAELGLTISAIAWLPNGSLALAAGSGILVADEAVPAHELDTETREALGVDTKAQVPIVTLPRALKQPLRAWHPRLFSHLVHFGRTRTATSLLHRLAQKLKFWSEGDDLFEVLDIDPYEIVCQEEVSDSWLNEDLIRDLTEQLQEKDLPNVSQAEQERLKHILDAIAFTAQHVNGLDKNALRFLFSWKVQLLSMPKVTETLPNGDHLQANGLPRPRPKPEPVVPTMHWRAVAFAYHSTTQQPLLDILTTHYDNKLSWPIGRKLGITAWLADKEALTSVFESLAQSAFRATDPPDPVNASLFFLALHKKQTLLGLWRIAVGNKEQKATMNFLKRDFAQAEAKTAAKKNAYALLGRRRFEYAAAFFLLAGDAASACNLLAGQCEDVMLAIAVARLYGGDDSAVLHTLIEKRLLPEAQDQGDRWLASWCHSMLSQQQEAMQVLVRPLKGVVVERGWHQDDPATLMLYKDLREKIGASEFEWEAVLRGARVLRRMGLWILALELVRNWREGPVEAPSMLDAFAPPAPAPADGGKAAREAKAAELLAKMRAKKAGGANGEGGGGGEAGKKPPPTQFKEPDPNSLLDSFGF
ncbi:Regulator of V-ATPase in vacuolar membrane protein 1 [Teratosphaeria destructans]|uniref:Regulator of V-ATPase in vacuolar membrane protein 1 n=1 Tax=Teratosphaeria destructans TaxID=418781 RepID=A0A9W7SWW7_9PEZI|nr:Regulator of V-ATPase in vacuolar membrane protein 1 [Teratosphaeria destructans]